MVRTLIDWQVSDLLEHTRARLEQARIRTADEVRRAPEVLAGPGPTVRAWKTELEAFLQAHVYRHYRVMRMAAKGKRFLHMLFDEYRRSLEQLPERYFSRARTGQPERTICDYLAGMTDRFAQDEFLRLFQPYVSV